MLTMDPEYSRQDVVRCHLCETPGPSLYCEICDISLCEDCKEKHLSYKWYGHKSGILPFILRGRSTKQKRKKNAGKLCKIWLNQMILAHLNKASSELS